MKLDENTRWTSDTHFRHVNVVKFDNSPFWSDKAKKLANEVDLAFSDEERKRLRRAERAELEQNVLAQDEAIIANWNKVVTDPNQLVLHLGDFTFSNDVALVESILDRLNGRIILIKGNHEQPVLKNKRIYNRFERVVDYLEGYVGKQRICMFHYPIHEWNQCHRGAWMLHGHTHLKDTYDKSYKICNVGMMNWDYSPISYQQLQIFMAAKKDKLHH